MLLYRPVVIYILLKIVLGIFFIYNAAFYVRREINVLYGGHADLAACIVLEPC